MNHLSSLLLLVLASTEPPKVSLGQMDWESLPRLSAKGGRLDGNPSRQAIRNIIKKRECELPGATMTDFGGITVWFAMRVSPDGQVSHIAVQPVGCRPLETLAGAMAKRLVDQRMINAPGGDETKWYASRVMFNE